MCLTKVQMFHNQQDTSKKNMNAILTICFLYFLPYVDNTVMLPVGPCISWVNDYTNEY